MEAERRFAYRWHPYAVDPKVDYSGEPMTLVEFRLDDVPGGTKLSVVESGFDQLPAHRRDETRLGWLLRLSAGGPGSIARLGVRARVSRQAVTKHLEVLAGAGLIRDRWQGRERIWEIDRARFADALGYLD